MTPLLQVTDMIKPQALTESRLQLHYAVQFIAATGAALAEPLSDYSHTSLSWLPDLEILAGSAIQASTPFRVAIDSVSLTLILLDQHSDAIASLPLNGKTMAEGLNWLQQETSQLGADASKIVFLDYPPDDFPDHPLAHGATFDHSQELALSELTDYYATTYQHLQTIIASYEDSTAIHIWPHHFDMATLITLPASKDGVPMTVGVGLSPGDSNYNEPYWYVSPYPYPDVTKLPAIAGGGFWHTEHWVGAVLTASRWVECGHADTRQQRLTTFLHDAVNKAISLLMD